MVRRPRRHPRRPPGRRRALPRHRHHRPTREADDDVPSDLEQRILRATVGRRPQNIFRQRLSAAAAVALLLLAGAALLFVPAPKAIESETYAEVEADPYIELTDSAQVAQTTLTALAPNRPLNAPRRPRNNKKPNK